MTLNNKTYRNWVFTWFHFKLENLTKLEAIQGDKCKYIIYGVEQSEDGKEHLQGYIELKSPVRMTGIKTFLDHKSSQIHVEPAKGKREYNRAYCSKGLQSHEEWEELKAEGPNYGTHANVYENTFTKVRQGQGKRNDWVELYEHIRENPDFSAVLSEYPEYAIKYPGGIQKAIDCVKDQDAKDDLAKELESLKLYKWEADLMKDLEKDPDPRSVIWYTDPIGGQGKTTFAKYLLSRGNCAYFTNAKTADIAYAYHGERTVIFDFARTNEGRINYGVVEQIKNGLIFSSKYNSGMKVNKIPHVICLSNFPPELAALSADRWDLRNLDKSSKAYCDSDVPLATVEYNLATGDPNVIEIRQLGIIDSNVSVGGNTGTQGTRPPQTSSLIPTSTPIGVGQLWNASIADFDQDDPLKCL